MSEPSDIEFSALTESKQFLALARRLKKAAIADELLGLPKLQAVQRPTQCDEDQVASWLRNGWSTEKLLGLIESEIPEEDIGCALQWAFPQSYYAAYAVAMGCFSALGIPGDTHQSVLKRFGERVGAGWYPAGLSFWCDGPLHELEFGGLDLQDTGSLNVDLDPPRSVDEEIAAFLRTTRKRDLTRRKDATRLLTKAGTRKKSFSRSDWSAVSGRLGPTTALSLLYRKRIKSNYGDVSSFSSWRMDADQVLLGLRKVVACINLAHEVYIERALGKKCGERVFHAAGGRRFSPADGRRATVLGVWGT